MHSTVSAFKTDHICHAQYTNYIAATHNITHSPCTSTCTPHPALHTPLLSTTLLCTQLTNTKHSCQNGTRCRDGVKLLWCDSHLVSEGSIPTCACFHSENFFVTLYLCLRPYTINFKCAFKYFPKIEHPRALEGQCWATARVQRRAIICRMS